jgi:hypothetical protein
MTEEETADADDLEPVAEFRDSVRAHLCQMALQASGVEAWLSQPNLAGVAPDLGIALGIEVLVRQSDAPAARELIGAFESGEVALPLEPTSCPRCGSVEAQYVPRPDRAGAILGTFLVGLPRPDVAWAWKCSRCGNKWQ